MQNVNNGWLVTNKWHLRRKYGIDIVAHFEERVLRNS